MNLLLLTLILILIIILPLKLLQEEYTNNIITNLLIPIEYKKYNDFKNKYPIINYKKIPIYIFYHICPKSSDNKHHIYTINEQMNELINSGLYNICDTVYYGCNCENCDIFLDNYFQQYTKVKKMKRAICPNTKTYKNLTINSMIEFAKESNHEFYGLYFHTKGMTNIHSTQNNWRHFMMYYLVTNYKLCIDILNRGFYTCGVNYLDTPMGKHYSGNFFWYNSIYLKKLDKITNIYDRMKAEEILFSKYIKNKHICISKKRYISMYIHMYSIGLYKFKNNYKLNIKNIDIGII
jgi:hypothetical protein